jgi:glycosyltransferase involved in cell wall biosynthesis
MYLGVSVVIPAYNEEKYIGDCLKSLRNQTIPPDEIIVVDNNSTDDTAEIAKKFGAIVIKERRAGTFFAMKTGFDNARFEIIARTDADTRVPENWIEKILQKFDSPKFEYIALAGTLRFDSSIIKITNYFLDYFFIIINFFSGYTHLYGCNMIVRKSIWNEVRQKYRHKKNTHEDYALSKLLNKLGKIYFVPDIQVITSGRRIKRDPINFFLKYTLNTINTYIRY